MDALFATLDAPTLPMRGPRARWEAARAVEPHPLLAAVRAGRGAHTVGEAFFAGYQAALERLTGVRAVQALLVTEAGGNHPREIHTTSDGRSVTGTKAFALDEVDVGWVLARAGEPVDGRADLVLARVDGDSGVTRERLEVGWLVDVPHSRIRFDAAPASEVRPDAWARYVRPFRGLEDLGVLAAVSAARLGATADPEAQEGWMAVLVGLFALWPCDPDAASTIRALAGIRAHAMANSVHPIDGPLAGSWERDSRLLTIAARAREVRLDRARSRA